MNSKKEKNYSASVSISMTGIVPEISKELRAFITQDEMEGFESLQFMLENEKKKKKVPDNIRKEYEAILAELITEKENAISEAIQDLEKYRSNVKKDSIKILQELTMPVEKTSADGLEMIVVIPM